MELNTLPFQVFLLNVTQTAGVQGEEGAGTHTCVPSFAHLWKQGSFILKIHYVSGFLSSSSALCRQMCRFVSTDTAARLMALWRLCSVSGQLGWVLVLRLRPVSVFHPNVRLARRKGHLQLRLLEQYSRTSVTRDQGEKHQRKPQHSCSTSKGSRAGCLPVRRLLVKRVFLQVGVREGYRDPVMDFDGDYFWFGAVQFQDISLHSCF